MLIRLLVEYASEVWGGCSSVDSDRLEKIQLIAVRIVTGLPIFAPLGNPSILKQDGTH